MKLYICLAEYIYDQDLESALKRAKARADDKGRYLTSVEEMTKGEVHLVKES